MDLYYRQTIVSSQYYIKVRDKYPPSTPPPHPVRYLNGSRVRRSAISDRKPRKMSIHTHTHTHVTRKDQRKLLRSVRWIGNATSYRKVIKRYTLPGLLVEKQFTNTKHVREKNTTLDVSLSVTDGIKYNLRLRQNKKQAQTTYLLTDREPVPFPETCLFIILYSDSSAQWRNIIGLCDRGPVTFSTVGDPKKKCQS